MLIRNLLFLILILSSLDAYSCRSANQERLFPIGITEDCLVAIEIQANRYGAGEYGEKTLWSYSFSLFGFNSDYSDFEIENFQNLSDIKEEEFKLTFQSLLKEAINKASTLPNFEILIPSRISFCDFQKSCSEVVLTEGDSHIGFHLTSMNKSYDVKFLSQEYSGRIGERYKDYFRAYDNLNENTLGFDLKVSSIREYSTSKFQITAFHLSTGQEFKSAASDEFRKKKEYAFEAPLNSVYDVVFLEPILHHGKGFDYYVIEIK